MTADRRPDFCRRDTVRRRCCPDCESGGPSLARLIRPQRCLSPFPETSPYEDEHRMPHRNAPLSVEGRRRLVHRCRTRPIAHVAAEMGISRSCASKWVNRFRRYGELGLHDRSWAPHRQPTATAAPTVETIERLRRDRKWSASRIAHELHNQCDIDISRRTVSRILLDLGLNRRRFIDADGQSNRVPRTINALRPGHMVHVDVKKAGRIPDGGGWCVHGRESAEAKVVASATRAGRVRIPSFGRGRILPTRLHRSAIR